MAEPVEAIEMATLTFLGKLFESGSVRGITVEINNMEVEIEAVNFNVGTGVLTFKVVG